MDHHRGSLTWVHASAVVVGEIGLLIRGPAGAGKSALALALAADGRRSGRFSRLVADDTVGLQPFGDRLVARPHPRTAGMAERRGIGIVPLEHEPACVIRTIVDFVPVPAGTGASWRCPEPEDLRTMLMGVGLPRLILLPNASSLDSMDRVLEHCRIFRPGS